MPSWVTVNNGAEIKTINIKNECLECIKNNSQCGQVGWELIRYYSLIKIFNSFINGS